MGRRPPPRGASPSSPSSAASDGGSDPHPLDAVLSARARGLTSTTSPRRGASKRGRREGQGAADAVRSSPGAPPAAPSPAAAPSPGRTPKRAKQDAKKKKHKEEAGAAAADAATSPAAASPAATPAPVGVVVLEDGALPSTSATARKLLRPARYFDGDGAADVAADVDALLAAGGGVRCYRCGGPHLQRECAEAPPPKPCFVCGGGGHDARACPRALCFRCGAPGHQARDCAAAATPDGQLPCLRCGRRGCAGLGPDRGPCQPSRDDLAAALCLACGERGHLCCAPATAPLPPPTCCLCGGRGHEADECRRWRGRW